MALLSSCKSVQMARSSYAAARQVLPVLGRLMQLAPRQQAPCRQLNTKVQVANMGLAQPAEGAAVFGEQAAPLGVQPASNAVFVSFSVYKNKGAMTVKPIKPTWEQLPSGAWQLQRGGALLFELANPVCGMERRYNWDQKVMIGLQANELSTIMADPDGSHQFYHDTFKGQQGREGTLVKTLKWSRAPDGQAYFINASVSDKANNINNNVSVSLTKSDFYTLKRLVDYAIPYMLGWDTVFHSAS